MRNTLVPDQRTELFRSISRYDVKIFKLCDNIPNKFVFKYFVFFKHLIHLVHYSVHIENSIKTKKKSNFFRKAMSGTSIYFKIT